MFLLQVYEIKEMFTPDHKMKVNVYLRFMISRNIFIFLFSRVIRFKKCPQT